jgi:hypothetical protein
MLQKIQGSRKKAQSLVKIHGGERPKRNGEANEDQI